MFRKFLIACALACLPSLVQAQPVDQRNPVFPGSGIVVGAPTGGNLGPGTINVQNGAFLNGQAVAGALAVPNTCVVGGNGTALTSVTIGANLSCAPVNGVPTLSAASGASLPTSAPLLGSNSGGAGLAITPANGLTISGTNLVPVTGTTSGTLAAGNDSRIVGALQSVPAPTLSVLGGLLAQTAQAGQFVSYIDSSGVQHFATPAGAGNVSNSGTPAANQLAVWINPTAIGGTSTLPSGVTASSLTSFGVSPTFVTPNLGTPSAAVLTNATGLPWTAGVVGKPTTATGYGIATIDGVPIGGTTPAAAAFTTLSATGNISFNGTGVIGSGLNPAEGQSYGPALILTAAVDHSTLPGTIRENQMVTTLSPSANTGNIWQNFLSVVNLNGPGTANGEIDSAVGQIVVNSGGTLTNGSAFESRIDNTGTVTSGINYLTFLNNNSGGTVNAATGIKGVFTNANTTAGAIGNYTFISFPAMGGVGSLPTTYYFMQNLDANANSALDGKLAVGLTAVGGAELTVKGPDANFSGWAFEVTNSAGTPLITVHDDGTTAFGGPITVAGNVTATAISYSDGFQILNGVAPTAATGAGVGSGGTVTVTGSLNAQIITVITGTTPTANAIIATLTLPPSASGNGPSPVISAGNAAAASVLADVWAAGSGAGRAYTINSTTALTAATTYVFNVHNFSS